MLMKKKVIGITGGIGSGKSTVVQLFKTYGIPAYTADDEAKKLMYTDEGLKASIIELLGNESYKDEKLNRAYIASKVFSNEQLLLQLNKLVHPAVHAHFTHWAMLQTSPSVVYEAAILIEQGRQSFCDVVILVTAPKEERIKRVMQRDAVSREEILARMNRQWSDDKKKNFANFVIENTNLHKTKENIQNIYKYLKNNHFF